MSPYTTEIKQTAGLKVKMLKRINSKYGSMRKSMPSLLAKEDPNLHRISLKDLAHK